MEPDLDKRGLGPGEEAIVLSSGIEIWGRAGFGVEKAALVEDGSGVGWPCPRDGDGDSDDDIPAALEYQEEGEDR